MNEKDIYSISQTYIKQNLGDFSREEVQKLQDVIKFHSELYYEKESPIISDSEYDELFKKLEVLEEEFWFEKKVSKSVGSQMQQSSFKKVAHKRPMISLDNTYNADELRDFDGRIKKILADDSDVNYTIEYKFDGLWVELVYVWWLLQQAITRWNGIQWEDVTENIKQITNIPQKIPYSEDIEIRGEVLMPLSSFEKLNTQAKEDWEKVFANPRNAASGSLRVLDTSITAQRDLKFFAYDVSDFESFGKQSYFDMVHALEKLGFEISNYFYEFSNISEIIKKIEKFADTKQKIDFEIDGLVVKVNTISLWKEVGYTQHHPRYAIAYKFPAEIQTTVIESVEHSVGRTGTITPVANVAPVVLSGATIRRSTLHNYDEIEKLDIRVGDSVFIKRAWEVIPKIVSVVKNVRDGNEQVIEVPSVCPSCWEKVYKDEDKVRYYCANTLSCPAQNREQLAYSVGKSGLDIDGLWERQIEIFLEEGIISNLVDIFSLSEKREHILELEWFQEKSVNNLLNAIEQVKAIDITVFLKSIGIPGVWKKTAKTLSKVFCTLSDVSHFSITQEDLIELDDIGPEVAKNVVDFFMKKKEFIAELLEVITVKFPENVTNRNGKYTWKKMCITGSFESYTRDQLVEKLEYEWGEFVSSVSKKTDYLLAGEKAGGKLKKAKDLGIEIVRIEDFLNI